MQLFLLLLIFLSPDLLFGMEGSYLEVPSEYLSKLLVFLLLRSKAFNQHEEPKQEEELADIKVENPEDFFFKQATLYNEIVKDKNYIFRLKGNSSILATPVERSLRPKGSMLYQVCLKEREHLTRFCVSPDNSKILALVSKIVLNQEVNQSGMVLFRFKEKEEYFSFDSFADIKKIFIKVELQELPECIKKGYSQLYQDVDLQNDQVNYGLLNSFNKMAVNNSGTRVVMSNNNSVYCFDLLETKAKHLSSLPTEPTYDKWPKIVDNIGFNGEGDKVKIKYKNNCGEEIISLETHEM